jgi:transketolase
VLSRQDLPVVDRKECAPASGLRRGAYVLWESPKGAAPEIILIGTGSEVGLCLDAARKLAAEGRKVRVVSMPSWDLFEAQSAEYRAEVLPPGVPTLAVEAGSSFGWTRYADDVVAIDRFGESAPGAVALANFGYTPENVAQRARDLLGA